MGDTDLARDYVRRAEARLQTLPLLLEAASWADVAIESQEAVELALKGLLRHHGVAPGDARDVSHRLLKARK